MHTNRVNIFHITYRNAVSVSVTHYFVLNLFPSCNTALYQNLSYTGKTKSVLQDLHQLFRIMCDTAAASSQCVCRTKYNRISDLIRECKTIFYVFYDQRSCNRFSDLFHRCFKFQTILCLFDCLRSCTDQADIVFS